MVVALMVVGSELGAGAVVDPPPQPLVVTTVTTA
jgi:hypothetical protein